MGGGSGGQSPPRHWLPLAIRWGLAPPPVGAPGLMVRAQAQGHSAALNLALPPLGLRPGYLCLHVSCQLFLFCRPRAVCPGNGRKIPLISEECNQLLRGSEEVNSPTGKMQDGGRSEKVFPKEKTFPASRIMGGMTR